MITIVAFVINIGLFVKAKINLQNATDAAAYAGASVQARQLSKIAYLNWEMRNIYKEWMYKYYVIGNLNIDNVEKVPSTGAMKFLLKPDVNVLTGDSSEDKYNIPAVCIHITGSKTNICRRYAIPGLPEFGSSNLPGAEEASRAFMDTLINTKVNDCIDRTRLNMLVANTWTYNVLGNSLDESLAGRGPAILADRQGAWPRAVELAMRIRNLEYMMNRPAVTKKTCIQGVTDLTGCSTSIKDIEQENRLGNERFVKAFYSGYRNLGNEDDNEMKATFTLSELAPKKVLYENSYNPSNLFIREGNQFREKQWVDLKLMMVNYAIFYAAMIPRADSKTSGACDISKVAIPVPGYPLGFYKDPKVVTYYAVKGEAEFIGMFNPFVEGAVKLQAYSAAKPMGGRIGPMLFMEAPGANYIRSRSREDKPSPSIPYIASPRFSDNYTKGVPLPTNSSNKPGPGPFWLTNEDKPVGGIIANADEIQFGVPNLVYDYQSPFSSAGYSFNSDRIFFINETGTSKPSEQVGLYSTFQFRKFKGENLLENITPGALDAEIARVRAPTLYEAAHYMIPTPNELNLALGLDAFGFIHGNQQAKGNVKVYNANIYAPLYKTNDQVDVMYENVNQVIETIFGYMRQQAEGMKKYRMAMNDAAIYIFGQKGKVAGGASGTASGYIRAADGVSDINHASGDRQQLPKSCKSLAGQFLYFYFGGVQNGEAPPNDDTCPKPLGELIMEYYTKKTMDPTFDTNFYHFEYSLPEEKDITKFMTAYMPGPFTGSQLDGRFKSPLSPANDLMRRNYYSTKFITLDSVLSTTESKNYQNEGFMIFSEGSVSPGNNKLRDTYGEFKNSLETMGEDVSDIKY